MIRRYIFFLLALWVPLNLVGMDSDDSSPESTEDLRPSTQSQYGSNILVNSQVKPIDNAPQSIRVGDGSTPSATPKKTSGWTLRPFAEKSVAQGSHNAQQSVFILPTTQLGVHYVVHNRNGKQTIARASVSRGSSSSQSTTRPISLFDEYDDVPFTGPVDSQSGQQQSSAHIHVGSSRDPIVGRSQKRFVPKRTPLLFGPRTIRPVQAQNNAPRGPTRGVDDADPDHGQPREHRFSFNIGIPVKFIAGIACIVVAGLVLKAWHEEQQVLEDENQTDNDAHRLEGG